MIPLGLGAGGGGSSWQEEAEKPKNGVVIIRAAERKKLIIFKESKLRKLLSFMVLRGDFFLKKGGPIQT